MRIHHSYSRLDQATDASWLSERLGKEIARRIGATDGVSVEVTRAFPRDHGGFTIQYRIPLAEKGDLYLCGHLLGDDECPPAHAVKRNDSVVWNEALRLVVPVFPYDPKLKALAELWSPRGAASLLTGLGWDHGEAASSRVGREMLAYRLEKRCVIRYAETPARSNGRPRRRVVAKLVRPHKLAAILRAHAALMECGFGPEATRGIEVARILYVDNRRATYVMQDAPGVSLHGLTGEQSLEDPYASAARVLRHLHARHLPWLNRYSSRDEATQLGDWIARIGPIFPEVSERFSACQRLVCDSRHIDPLPGSQVTCIHRDFYDKQLLWTPELTTLLDYDNIACGDPAQDYGNFLAHVTLRKLQFPSGASQLDRGREAFSQTYARNEDSFLRRAAWWQAATLLRLAALYALRPKWRHLTSPLLEEVNTCMQTRTAKGQLGSRQA